MVEKNALTGFEKIGCLHILLKSQGYKKGGQSRP
jgi:hypothetical protein